MTGPRPRPGDSLLHPVPLAAIGLLLVNDHLLKTAWPGAFTGKLSDVAGLVLFPLVLVAAWELARAALGRPGTAGLWASVVAVASTGVVFSLIKLDPTGAHLYRVGLGMVQWPFAAAMAMLTAQPIPALGRVVSFVADPSDLVALPALVLPLAVSIARAPRPEGPAASLTAWGRAFSLRGENLAVAGLAAAMYAGAVIDAWSHVHLPASLETILTPSHALVYTAFAGLVATVAGTTVIRMRSGIGPLPMGEAQPLSPAPATFLSRFRAAVRPGHGVTIAGIVVFLAAGAADSAWHVAFGIEADAEALVSPTHLLLAVGAGMIAAGPVWASWLARARPRWPEFLPVAIGMGTLVGLCAFALHLAHPLVDPWPSYPFAPGSPTYWAIAPLGVASAALQASIIAGGLAFILRAWPNPPRGASAIVVVMATAPLVVLHDQQPLLSVAALGGLAAELVNALSGRWATRTRILAATTTVPSMLWVAEIAVLASRGAVEWSAHLVAGTLLIVAVIGFLVGLLATLPAAIEPSGDAPPEARALPD
jgi:hypothetical protein